MRLTGIRYVIVVNDTQSCDCTLVVNRVTSRAIHEIIGDFIVSQLHRIFIRRTLIGANIDPLALTAMNEIVKQLYAFAPLTCLRHVRVIVDAKPNSLLAGRKVGIDFDTFDGYVLAAA
jgi:hypothetical protein